MRYNKTIIAALIAAFALTGCGNSVPSTEAPKTEPTTVVTTEQATEPTTKVAEEVKIIGTKKDGDSVYKVQFVNSTGKDIVGFTVKPDTDKDYPANMMTKGDIFKNKEIRELYYDAKNDPDTDNSDSNSNSPVLTTAYTIKVDFSDNTAAQLHQFPFEDTKSAILKFEDGVLYMIYKSETSGDDVVTKEAEKMIKDNPETSYDTDPTPNNEKHSDSNNDNSNDNNNTSGDDNNSSGNSDNTQNYTPQPDNNSGSQGGGAAQQTPVVSALTDPPVVQVAPTPTEAPAGGDNGCLGDGALFNDGDSSSGDSNNGCLGDGALFN